MRRIKAERGKAYACAGKHPVIKRIAYKKAECEKRRGNTYDGILMDPPSYGRGPAGEVWMLENDLLGLVDTSAKVLSDKPLFFLINSYTTGFQASVLSNLLM